jgi:uncharacterized protein YkwD
VGHYIRNRRSGWALGVLLCLAGSSRPAVSQGIDTSGFAGQVLALLNQQRTANGLPALHEVGPLDQSAEAYSETMMEATAGGAVYLSHTSPDGASFSDRIAQAGYNNWTSLGENIAAGQRSPQEVVDAWMNSPGHRANILDGSFRDVGIGVAVGPGAWPGGFVDPSVIWWTTDFGARSTNDGGGSVPTPSPPPALAGPSIQGYTATNGVSIFSAPPGAPVLIVGSNLGSSGVVRVNGAVAGTSAWSSTSITFYVPAASSYPAVGPVTVSVNGQTASGPAFTITAPAPSTPPSTPAANSTPTTTPQPTPNPEPNPTPQPTPVPSSGTAPAPSSTSSTNPGPTPSASTPASPAGSLSVTTFGARGDGSANDAPAIQAAIDAAQPGGAVYIAAGTYRLDNPLVVRRSGVTVWGAGATTVLQHGGHVGLQLGDGAEMASGLQVRAIQFVGLPGSYRADGNSAEAIRLSHAVGTVIRDCVFRGSGIAVRDDGATAVPSNTRLSQCQVQGWGDAGFILTSGDRVERCSLAQNDPLWQQGRSGNALRIVAGSVDVQVTDSTITGTRAAAVEIEGSSAGAITSNIQLRGLTVQDCFAGIALTSGSSATAVSRQVVVEGCSILRTYGGPGLSVKQGEGIDIHGNEIDGGPIGLELGNWGSAERPGAIVDLQAVDNTFQGCDYGITARVSRGGSLTRVTLSGNSLVDCHVPLDLSGAPGVSAQ